MPPGKKPNFKRRLMGMCRPENEDGDLNPLIGFKMIHNRSSDSLSVVLIGGRDLPLLFGLNSAKGFIVQVKLYPIDDEYESQIGRSAWPTWNETFTFSLKREDGGRNRKYHPLLDLSECVLSLEVYAVFEKVPDKKSIANNDSKFNSQPNLSKNSNYAKGSAKPRMMKKKKQSGLSKSLSNLDHKPSFLENHLMLGTVKCELDLNLFKVKMNLFENGTSETWKPILKFDNASDQIYEPEKVQVDITLLYAASPNGFNDVIEITVNKMHCPVHLMKEYLSQTDMIYIKVGMSDKKSKVSWKSEEFFPTTSIKWHRDTSCARLRFESTRLPFILIYISLGYKKRYGLKTNLGKIIIGNDTPHAHVWKDLISCHTFSKTYLLTFE